MGKKIGLVLTSMFLAMGLIFPVTTPRADNIPPGKFAQWSTTAVSTKMAPSKDMMRPSKVIPRLESSLNQLFEVRMSKGLAEAKSFAERRIMVLRDDRVQVVIVTREENVADIVAAVKAAGGEYQTHYRNLVQALVPIMQLEVLSGRPDVQVIRQPRRPRPLPARPELATAPQAQPQEVMPPRLTVGRRTTQGVAASNASSWHAAGYTGAGVRVAVIDAGFVGYGELLGSDLPASVSTYDWTGTGIDTDTEHGAACAEVVYDMAYGATMDLHKVGTEVDLGNAVDQAIFDGVDIITMSLGWTYPEGPGDGTGILSDIVNSARSNGIFYATAAGNNAETSWSGTFADDGSGYHLWAPGQNVNFFGPGDHTHAYNIPAGYPIEVALHWDDWTVVDQDYDMFLIYWDGSSWDLVAASTNDQAGTYPTPDEYIGVYAPYEGIYGVVVQKYSATRDVCFRLIAWHGDAGLDQRIPQRSLIWPADSPDAITVGAVDVSSPYPLEDYSSQGPTFGPGGACLGGSMKPDIASYANVDTMSYGRGGFNGTSAATPHVAGAAALVKEANPAYTVAEVQNYLETNALDRGSPGKDNSYGSGRLFLRTFYEYVTLLSPGGGEMVPSGSIHTIQWGAPSEAVSFKLQYSINNGATWKLIDSGVTTTTYDWTVPTLPTNKTKCLVKVVGYDASGKKFGADRSASTFTIAVLALTSPNGGETLTGGSLHTITWQTNATKKPVEKVKLTYTKDGGTTWLPIATLTGGDPGTYDWTVPDVPKVKSKCKAKVVLKDAAGKTLGTDTSDGKFTIEPAVR